MFEYGSCEYYERKLGVGLWGFSFKLSVARKVSKLVLSELAKFFTRDSNQQHAGPLATWRAGENTAVGC